MSCALSNESGLYRCEILDKRFSGPTGKQIAVVMFSSQPRTVVSFDDSHKGKFNGIML